VLLLLLLLLLFVAIGLIAQLLILLLVPVQLLMLLFDDDRVAASENEEDLSMEDAEIFLWAANNSLVGNMGPLRECLRFPGSSTHLVSVSCVAVAVVVAVVAFVEA